MGARLYTMTSRNTRSSVPDAVRLSLCDVRADERRRHGDKDPDRVVPGRDLSRGEQPEHDGEQAEGERVEVRHDAAEACGEVAAEHGGAGAEDKRQQEVLAVVQQPFDRLAHLLVRHGRVQLRCEQANQDHAQQKVHAKHRECREQDCFDADCAHGRTISGLAGAGSRSKW